jgi:hypothetical protein
MEKYNEKYPSNVYEKFHGIPLNFPWNSMEKYNETNPSNVNEKFHGIPWKIP